MADEQNFNYLRTFGGWAIVLVIGVALYYRNKLPIQKQSAKAHAQAKSTADNVSDALASTKKKAERALKQKTKPKAAPVTSEKNDTAVSTSNNFDKEEDAAANSKLDREFAKQFSSAKTGTQFTGKKAEDKRQKSVKQSRAQEKEKNEEAAFIPVIEEPKPSAPSSTTGDADDDMSDAVSPAVQAADRHDVSDMLEKPSLGPSVLRLTDTDAVKSKPKKTKEPEVVESKKQRQNKKKAEAAKLAREEDEKDRKVRMEAQRRAARIAEGRPAKDGSTFTVPPPKDNAWTAKADTNGDSNHGSVQPLDTFSSEAPKQPEPVVPTVVAPPSTKQTGPVNKERSDSWMSSLPSEEEQMDLLRQDDAWSEVTGKKKKGKKGPAADSTSAAGTNEPFKSATPVAASKPNVPVNGTNKNLKPTFSSSSSFAALTPEETTDDNEEVEWDV
jgi:hypothetical protein